MNSTENFKTLPSFIAKVLAQLETFEHALVGKHSNTLSNALFLLIYLKYRRHSRSDTILGASKLCH